METLDFNDTNRYKWITEMVYNRETGQLYFIEKEPEKFSQIDFNEKI